MIVRNKRNPLVLLFAWRGTIFPKVLPTMLLLSGISVILSIISHYQLFHIPTPPILGFTIFGLILSIFLGFRNNACYDRWWEGRKLWGALIATQRNLSRECQILPYSVRERILQRVILFTHVLRDRLRYQTAHHELFLEYFDSNLKNLDNINLNHPNLPQYILEQIQLDLINSLKNQEINEIVYTHLSKYISDFGAQQAGCDRIASTPLPFSYSVLLYRAIYSFCFMLPFSLQEVLGIWTPVMIAWLVYMFLGLDALSAQLEDPFGKEENNLPLDAIVRLVERELLISLNKTPPQALEPHDFNLS